MMTNQKIFADLAELAGGAVGVLSSLRQQLRDEAKQRFDEMTERMDLVTRDDLRRLEGMIMKLNARLDALEGRGRAPQPKATAPRAKPATKKPARRTNKTTHKKS
jgi:hypothetical protein